MRVVIAFALIAIAFTSVSSAEIVSLFEDDFSSFSLGTAWQGTVWDGGVAGQNATGVPDVVLTGNVDHDGAATLQMTSSTNNTSAEFKGIETVTAIPTTGILSLTLDVRTTAGNSHMPIEAALVGESGEWMKMYYTYTAWTANYDDSSGNHDEWGHWHDGTHPDEYRRWVMTIDSTGVIADIYDAGDTLRETWSFTGLTLADLGTTASVVLRQQLGGDFASPGTAAPTVWVDSVAITANVPEPGSLILAILGCLCAVGWRRRSSR